MIGVEYLGDCRVHDVVVFFFFQAEDGIRDVAVTGVQTCALPIYHAHIDDLAGVDVSIVRRSNRRGGAGVEIADVGQPCAAWVAVLEGKADETTPIDDQVRSQTAVIYTGDSVSAQKARRRGGAPDPGGMSIVCDDDLRSHGNAQRRVRENRYRVGARGAVGGGEGGGKRSEEHTSELQ